MKRKFMCLLSGVVIFIIFFFRNAQAQYVIPISVFGNGGNSLSSSTNKFVSTLGQSCVGTMSNWSIRHNAGFWNEHMILITSVEENLLNSLQGGYRLLQNYPNPFNVSTTISFCIGNRACVKLEVFDVLGKEVVILVDGVMDEGEHSVVFDAKDLPNGVYYCCLITPYYSQVILLELLR